MTVSVLGYHLMTVSRHSSLMDYRRVTETSQLVKKPSSITLQLCLVKTSRCGLPENCSFQNLFSLKKYSSYQTLEETNMNVSRIDK